MEGNLTLKIDDSILQRALVYAKQRGLDLSLVIEDFLMKFVASAKLERKKLVVSDEVKTLSGALSASGEDWKARKMDYLSDKYGRL